MNRKIRRKYHIIQFFSFCFVVLMIFIQWYNKYTHTKNVYKVFCSTGNNSNFQGATLIKSGHIIKIILTVVQISISILSIKIIYLLNSYFCCLKKSHYFLGVVIFFENNQAVRMEHQFTPNFFSKRFEE